MIQTILLTATTINGAQTVTIEDFKLNLSDEQRKYYFLCIGIAAPVFGYKNPYELHKVYKQKFLPELFKETNLIVKQKNGEKHVFRDLWDAMSIIKSKLTPQEFAPIRADFMDKYLSITLATVPVMSKYIDCCLTHGREFKGIDFPIPEMQGILNEQ